MAGTGGNNGAGKQPGPAAAKPTPAAPDEPKAADTPPAVAAVQQQQQQQQDPAQPAPPDAEIIFMDAQRLEPYPTQSAAFVVLMTRGLDPDRYVITNYGPGFVLVRVKDSTFVANKQARLEMMARGGEADVEPGMGKRFFRVMVTPRQGWPEHYPILNGPHGQWHIRAGVECIIPEAAYAVLLVAVSDIMKTEGQDLIVAGKMSHLPVSVHGLATKEEYVEFITYQNKVRASEKHDEAINRANNRPGALRRTGAGYLSS